MSRCKRFAAFVSLALLPSGALTAFARGPLKIGEVRPYRAETPHPYPRGTDVRPVVWSDTVVSPDATFLRIHFIALDLGPGDYLTVSDPARTRVHTYTGRGPKGTGDVWAFAVEGDTAVIDLHAGRSPGHGYRIDAVAHGTARLDPIPELLCSEDGKEDVACHTRERPFDAAQAPITLFSTIDRRGNVFMCTGWLVSGLNDSTVMTASHCLNSQDLVDTAEARFNVQHTRCGGTVLEEISSYAGDRFLIKDGLVVRPNPRDSGLDYALFTLLGNPEATWGELVPSTRSRQAGDLIWIIGHPRVLPKKVSYWEDAAQTVRCQLIATDQTRSFAPPGSLSYFDCDVEGGNSGSPVVDAVTGQAIALVNSGIFDPPECFNIGTQMNAICAHAGALLNCVAD